MAQINLLNNEVKPSGSGAIMFWLVRILTVVLILTVLTYGYLWWAVHSATKNAADMQDRAASTQADIFKNVDRNELITRQQQLIAANSLINKHVSWSYFLPELARVTLKSASYVSIVSEGGNKITISANLPNYGEVDKFLQVFDLPDFNQQFSNIKVVSINQDQSGTTTGPKVRIEMTINPNFTLNRFQ